MKLVTAYIQPDKLSTVKEALRKAEILKMSVSNALGSPPKGVREEYDGRGKSKSGLLKKVRLEIAVNDEYLKPTVKAIIKGAKSGKIGDGKIFITELYECVRIRTEETGSDAIG